MLGESLGTEIASLTSGVRRRGGLGGLGEGGGGEGGGCTMKMEGGRKRERRDGNLYRSIREWTRISWGGSEVGGFRRRRWERRVRSGGVK